MRSEGDGRQVAELPRVGGHVVFSVRSRLFGVDARDAAGQFLVGGHGDRYLTLRHGHMLLECLSYIKEGVADSALRATLRVPSSALF